MSSPLDQVRSGSRASRLRFLFASASGFALVAAAGKALSLFTVPILTRSLSAADYGAADVLAVTSAVLIACVILGQDSAVARFFYETDDVSERRQIASQALLMELVACLLLLVGVWPFAERLMAARLGSPAYGSAVRLMLAGLPFVVLFQFAQNLLKWSMLRWRFMALSLTTVSLIVCLTVYFAVFLELGVAGIFAGQLLGMAIGSAGGLALCRPLLAFPRDLRYLPRLLAFGWPYLLIGCGTTLLPAFDRLFATGAAGLAGAGLYAAGAKLALAVLLPAEAFQMAWGPFSFGLYRADRVGATYDAALRCFTLVISLWALLMVASAEPLLTLLASERYAAGVCVVLPLAMAAVARAIGSIAGIGVDLSKKTYFHLVTLFLSLAISVPAMWLLGLRFGLAGVAWGVLLGQVVRGLTQTALGHWLWPARFPWARAWLAVFLAVACGAALGAAPTEPLWLTAVWRLLILAVAAGCLGWMLVLPAERSSLAAQARRAALLPWKSLIAGSTAAVE